MFITPKQISDKMKQIAYEAYWQRNAGFKDVIAAAINNWDGARWYEVQVPDDESDDIRYVLKKTGIILPL